MVQPPPDFDDQRPALPGPGRVLDLFSRGKLVEMGKDDNGTIYVWCVPATESEREEALLAGAMAQAVERVLCGEGAPAHDALASELLECDQAEMVARLLVPRSADAWMLGQDDLHADPDWKGERLLLVERADATLASGVKLDEESLKALAQVNRDYVTAWREKAVVRLSEFQAELNRETIEDLRVLYLKTWHDLRCSNAQSREYGLTVIFYGTRMCCSPDGRSHTQCGGHTDKLFASVEQVRNAPDELRNRLLSVYSELDETGGESLKKAM